MQRNNPKICVILNDIRSLYNVGAIFRTCDAAGIDTLYLCGITGHPDAGYTVGKKINKTALGNVKYVKWKYYKHIKTLINKLKKENFDIVSIELARNARSYKDYKLKKDTAFIFGNEVEGIDEKILQKSDEILCLPMRGNAISLNVATTVGIILYHYI